MARTEATTPLKVEPRQTHALAPARLGGPVPRTLQAAWLVVAALFATLLLGYHPFAEDGGIYAAAVEARLHPTLFPHDRVWVVAHTRFALFVPVMATTTRVTQLSPATTLLVAHLAGLLALLAAAAHLARSCVPGQHRPWLAVLVITVSAGLPVAGTALYIVDPYCTARTLTTPLLLFALSFASRARWQPSLLCWTAALALHPLMAIWGALPLLLTAALFTRSPVRWTLALTFLIFTVAAILYAASPRESAGAYAVAHTRAYWFPAEWRWYEWVGAAAPCLLLAAAPLPTPQEAPTHSTLKRLALAGLGSISTAVVLALCFARETAPSLAIARLQPMRSLHLVFVASLVACAAVLQNRLRSIVGIAAAFGACAIAAGSLFAMQRALYPHTSHLEWPGAPPANGWASAFLWCRDNTPPDAQFALSSEYINLPGEDSMGFRAIALRSALPDHVKDAGIAAVLPALTPAWLTAVDATRDLNRISDAQRQDRLLPLGVTWIVLPASATTGLACPYRNAAAQVCRLR